MTHVNFKHGYSGKSKTPEYKTWTSIIERCHSPRSPRYPLYGANGIAVCDRWRESFLHFLADMGCRPSDKYSIDRIDNRRGYDPDNCRWATEEEQKQNASYSLLWHIDGKVYPSRRAAARALDVPPHVIVKWCQGKYGPPRDGCYTEKRYP